MYRNKLKIIFVVFLSILFVVTVKAQQQKVISSSGGNLKSSNYSVSFTLGEPVIKTFGQNNLLITQGFQQSKLVVTAISQIKNLSINIQAYPNPVSNYLHLVSSEKLSPGSSYQLYNMNGACITEKKLEDLVTEVEFQSLVSATYFLKVIQNNKILKTFKIIKQ